MQDTNTAGCRARVQNSLRTLVMIWGAMLMSQVPLALIYTGVLPMEFPDERQTVLLVALAVFSLILAGLSLVVPIGPFLKSWSPPIEEVEDRDTESMFRDASKRKRVAVNSECAVASAIGPIHTHTILRLALGEVPANFAVVSRFVGAPLWFALALGALSVTMVALSFPSRELIRRRLERQLGAEISLD